MRRVIDDIVDELFIYFLCDEEMFEESEITWVMFYSMELFHICQHKSHNILGVILILELYVLF